MNALLQAILKDEHRQHGLSLTETEDFIYLWQTNHRKPVATFSAQGVALSEIVAEADKYLTGNAVTEMLAAGRISFESK